MPSASDGHIPDRREVVQIHVAIARLLERALRFDQLVVLRGELLLVHLQFVQNVGEDVLIDVLRSKPLQPVERIVTAPAPVTPWRAHGSSL